MLPFDHSQLCSQAPIPDPTKMQGQPTPYPRKAEKGKWASAISTEGFGIQVSHWNAVTAREGEVHTERPSHPEGSA